MEKISVKKPFTVLVGVIIAVVLGIVSMTNMQLDLLPDISLPYHSYYIHKPNYRLY